MAQARGPLFSLEAGGQIGKSLVYGKNKSRNTIRSLVKPQNKHTLKQFYSRGRIKLLNVMWSLATMADKASWLDLATAATVSTYNAFLTYNLNRLKNNEQPTVNRSHAVTVPLLAIADLGAYVIKDTAHIIVETDTPTGGLEFIAIALNTGNGFQGEATWDKIIIANNFATHYNPETGTQETVVENLPKIPPEDVDSVDYWAWAAVLSIYGFDPGDINWSNWTINFHVPEP